MSVEAWKNYIRVKAPSLGLPVESIFLQIKRESNWNPKAQGAAGEIGLMQIMPDTARQMGYQPEELWEPIKNIDCGLKYLAWIKSAIQKKANWLSYEDLMRLTFISYNGGIGYVLKAIENAGSLASVEKILNALQSTRIRFDLVMAYSNAVLGELLGESAKKKSANSGGDFGISRAWIDAELNLAEKKIKDALEILERVQGKIKDQKEG